MERNFPDFQNSMEWNLVGRHTYQVQPSEERGYFPLPDRSFVIENSHLVIVGINCLNAPNAWNTGGWVTVSVPFLPSTTSIFTANTVIARKWLKLRQLNLIELPKLLDFTIVSISFPFWFENATVEVWRYDGEDVSVYERLSQIEGQLGSL